MNARLISAIGAVIVLVASSGAAALEQTTPGAEDPRIRTVFYDPEQVVSVVGDLGYQMMIEFGDAEHIENVSIGDALGWQVTPNKKATLLFLKPVAKGALTNMTVVTDRRRYAFELRARASGPQGRRDMTYLIRFLYPPDPRPPTVQAAPPPAAPVMRNRAYSYTGSRAVLPALVFDDGRFTYFRWPEGSATPALFLVDQDGSESLVNYGVRDGYQIVEQVAPRFVLRNGKDIAYVINDAWREPNAGPLAPRPHDRKTSHEAQRAGAPMP